MPEIRFFENLSIQKKIGLGFGITSLLFAIVVWQYHMTLFRTLTNYEQLQSVYVTQKFHSLNIHRYMLEARRSEKDFLTRKDPEYENRVKKYVDLVLEEAAALQAIESRIDGPAAAELIRESMKTYHAAFQDIVEAWKIKGLDHQSGLQGRFRETIHRAETKAEGFRTGALYLALLQIRRGEKDLGLRRTDHYTERVHELGERFKVQVVASALDTESKTALLAAMDEYLVAFDQYAARVILDNDVAGGKGEFRNVAHHLEGLLRNHYVPDLEMNILMLRRNEKDYLLRGDKRYVENVRSVVQDILGNIADSEIPAQEKESLRGELLEYEKDFLALVEQNDRIIMLTAQMRNAVHQIEPLVSSNLQETTARVAQTMSATQQHSKKMVVLALSLSIAAILLAIFLAIVIARRITRPVLTLVGLAELVAGHGDESGIEQNKDEIATLAVAMGRMAGNHRQMLTYLGEHKDNLEKNLRDLDTIANNLNELADESMAAKTVGREVGNEVKELTLKLRQEHEDMSEIVRELQILLNRHEIW